MNAFEQLAEAQIPNPRKARLQAADKRRQKALTEQRDLLTEWRRWRRERVDALLAGPWGEAAASLIAFLDVMDLDQADELIRLVKQGPWHQADPDTRFEILNLVDTGITRLRERNGLAPFDDSLPGEEPTAFELIREHLR
jgi:hypothetical protein